jgi:lipoprotein-anchoring transpeptidase ErfK/SrfK
MRGAIRAAIFVAACAAPAVALAGNDGLAILGLEDAAPPLPEGVHGGLFGLLASRAATAESQPPIAAPSAPPQTAALAPQAAAPAPQTNPEPQGEPEARFRRQEVDYTGPEAPGTIIIDTPDKFLFLVEPNGRATRYGVGVGRPGFEWSGVKRVTRKAEWPGWTPPAQMLLRRPDLPQHMGGGPGNPLGARALYLGSSLYRIHGTNEPSTIGKNVSSGCIRMLNDEVIDLYNRVPVGAKVIVM